MVRATRRVLFALAACVGLLAGPPAQADPQKASVRVPPVDGMFDYQIGGAYPALAGVKIVDRDRTDKPAAGRYNICYINAFQAQPAESGWWQRFHPTLLLRDSRGRIVYDTAWGEPLLAPTTNANRASLLAIESEWLRGCAAAGFQAVELDNLDSYSRSHGLISPAVNVAFARMLAMTAHRFGLAVAQKNASELAPIGRRIGFDFAIAEECQGYAECGAYMATYGRNVIEIEYPDNGGLANFAAACRARGKLISVIYRDRNVVPEGTGGYIYRTC